MGKQTQKGTKACRHRINGHSLTLSMENEDEEEEDIIVTKDEIINQVKAD